MRIKIIAMIIGFLGIGALAFFGPANYKTADKTPFDFGDAPDGKPTAYEATGDFAQTGYFPSLLASDGARTQKTDEVWLGQTATTETDSRQIDQDEADDGVKLDLSSCNKSTAYFFVRIKNPGETQGTAYLNLYTDWNKDGKWDARDECAEEWAVRNFAVDLDKQKVEIAVYSLEFTAGKNVEKIWYRGVVTLNQQMSEASSGDFQSGEVEDYGPKLSGDEKYYGFYCVPDPLKIKHGGEGTFKILPDFFSEPISDIAFGQSFQQLNFIRKATLQKNVVRYESSYKDVDPPGRSDVHYVDLKVGFGGGVSQNKSCTVIVEHGELTTKTPSGKSSPKPSGAPAIKTESGGLTKTEDKPSPPPSDSHIQEGAPGLMEY